eukprot:834857-Amphidinium_carterae.1
MEVQDSTMNDSPNARFKGQRFGVGCVVALGSNCGANALSSRVYCAGSPACIACPVGSFANSLASASCLPCAPGQHQNSTGQEISWLAYMCQFWLAFDQCYSYKEDFRNITSYGKSRPTQEGCVDCAAGTFAPGKRSESCWDCIPGLRGKVTTTECRSCHVSIVKVREQWAVTLAGIMRMCYISCCFQATALRTARLWCALLSYLSWQVLGQISVDARQTACIGCEPGQFESQGCAPPFRESPAKLQQCSDLRG